ncbi:hypothetical protein ATCC51562_631 [Campylobacter concisus ATCC 51562]|uniref:Uncharacterized protein n=1 Tax=Campylobacter concisus ATCC 51562 TaxID=1242969 RepID=U2F8Q0_9BACT|nr:hypothetical protein ATCC51562_631 [Campylobacter concisus ATCC 51562]
MVFGLFTRATFVFSCMARGPWLNFVKLARYQSYKRHIKRRFIRSQSKFCSKTRWRNFLYIILQTLLKAI